MEKCLYCNEQFEQEDDEEGEEYFENDLFYFEPVKDNSHFYLRPKDRFIANEGVKKRLRILKHSQSYLETLPKNPPEFEDFIISNINEIEKTYNELLSLLSKKIYSNSEISLLSHICHSELFFRRFDETLIDPIDFISEPFIFERLSPKNSKADLESISDNHNIYINTHESLVSGACITTDNQFLFTTGEYYMIMWDLSSKTIIHAFEYNVNPEPVIVTNDSSLVISGSADDFIRIWDINTKDLISELEDSYPMSLGVTKNNKILIEGSTSGNLIFWNLETFTRDFELVTNCSTIQSLVLSSDNKMILTGSDCGNVKLWDLFNKQEIRLVENQKYRVFAVAITNDCRYVLSGSGEGPLRIFDLKENRNSAILEGHDGNILSIKLYNDDKNAITCGTDFAVKVWDIFNGLCLSVLIGHKGSVLSLAVSYDGKYCVSGGNDSVIFVWKLDCFKVENEIFCYGKCKKGWLGRDNNILYCYYSKYGINVWDLEESKKIMNVSKCKLRPYSVCETENRKYFVVASKDHIFYTYRFRR
ncbi:hypothetical protein SteCoe_3890 [Stentor coeruleus]|uniref:Uncharacterized protein n=1 Tax=Stentor coeruleus TaxID=5963 RepID=A0A1R2CW36_9CILI|nr:hypothetical protein SteCoe_3890 [Stentor coeruleus]